MTSPKRRDVVLAVRPAPSPFAAQLEAGGQLLPATPAQKRLAAGVASGISTFIQGLPGAGGRQQIEAQQKVARAVLEPVEKVLEPPTSFFRGLYPIAERTVTVPSTTRWPTDPEGRRAFEEAAKKGEIPPEGFEFRDAQREVLQPLLKGEAGVGETAKRLLELGRATTGAEALVADFYNPIFWVSTYAVPLRLARPLAAEVARLAPAVGRAATKTAAKAAVRVPVRRVQEAGLRLGTGRPRVAGASEEAIPKPPAPAAEPLAAEAGAIAKAGRRVPSRAEMEAAQGGKTIESPVWAERPIAEQDAAFASLTRDVERAQSEAGKELAQTRLDSIFPKAAPGATLERGAGAPTAPVTAAGQVLPPPAPAAPVAAARVPLMITRAQRQALLDSGLTKAQVDTLTPQQAQDILGSRVAAPLPAAAGGAAPPPVKPPVTTGGEEFAANIRLSKYPEDIRGTVKAWAEAHADEVQGARRGVRSDAEVLADARALVEEMGGDFAKVQRRWKPGEAWNAEEVTAIRGVLREKTQEVFQAAQTARASNSAANHANLLLAMQEQGRVQEIVHGITAEAGRALRAFRQEAFDAIKANDNRRLEELLRRLGDRAKLDDVAAALGKLDLTNDVAVNEFLRNASKPSLWDYVMELYINGLLSGPKTHIVNALSNTVNALVSPVERLGAAGVERILAPLQRRSVERFFSEVPADAFGAMEGIREGARAGLTTLKNGINPSQLSKWEFRRTAFRGNLGRVIRAPGTALEAADAMGYAINYRAALNARIIRQARSEGLKGQALVGRVAELKIAPTEALIKGAQETAEYRLFRNESQFANALLDFRGKYPAARFVIPFVRTPINLVKFGLERSPIGFLNPSLWRNVAAKNPEASDQIARAVLGSMLAALVAWQFGEGRITGAAPTSAAERDRFYREGKLPFAVRIGDTWVQYQRLEPFNQPITQVAAAIEAMEAKDKTANEKVQQAVSTMGKNLVSQTFLSGLNNLLSALTEPERYGPTFLARQAASLIPFSSLLRTAGQTFDPTFRKPRTLVEQIESGLPGLSRNVPPVLTAFGEEAPRVSPAFSPILISPAQQSAIDAELSRLGVEVGFAGKSIGGIELNREQQMRYQQVSGQLIKQYLLNLISSQSYQDASDVEKQAWLEGVINAAREAARNQLLPELVQQLEGGALTPAPAPTPAPAKKRDVVMAGAP